MSPRQPTSILITGASSGIGAALAIQYAAEGVTLYLLARNVARLEEVAGQCRARGAHVCTQSIDVCERVKLAHYITDSDTKCPIDLVIANAGISGEQTRDDANAIFDVNVNGVLNTIHPLIPRMVARGAGHIAIMSSLASICALPSAPAYSASKAAVRYYGEALHSVLKPRGVAITVICPGWITTPLTAKNNFPMPLIVSAQHAALMIHRGLTHKRARILFPLRIYFLLRALTILPHYFTRTILNLLPKNG